MQIRCDKRVSVVSRGVRNHVTLLLTRFIIHPSLTLISYHVSGQYWGEMGYFRIELGKNILGIEHRVAWATPGRYTEANYPCWENGKNCGPATITRYYQDPSLDLNRIQRRLMEHREQ